jgi:hypothetical protein
MAMIAVQVVNRLALPLLRSLGSHQLWGLAARLNIRAAPEESRSGPINYSDAD